MEDVGERAFLKRIRDLIDDSLLQFNDDASAVLLPSGEVMVLNVDMLVFKTDVLPGMSFVQIGKKAVTMSVSDIIAKGAKPYGCLASLGLKSDTKTMNAQNILCGVKKQCVNYDAKFLGGDLNESSDIILDVVTYGICKTNQLIPRKGVKSGDLIYCTGLFGLTSLGYRTLMNDLKLPSTLKKKVLSSVYEPKARVDFLPLFDILDIKICMDSSDGLLITLTDLSLINNLGIEVNSVPIDKEVLSFAEDNDLNPLELAFRGGEEFELIFAIDSSKQQELQQKAEHLGLTIHYIGKFNEDETGLKIKDSSFSGFDFPKEGFEHFQDSS
jgi:thiamine-monophosphate kinase